MSLIPDPTADLHWSDYRGAIHEIFSQNAQKHPDRLCVVETASSTSPRREFTYRQIDEATNILSHHLIQNGIERGDVVMVYSSRNVDLVIAIMGVLKAGATFSVIDPQYPPDRQIIYLDVAQPKGLIILQTATEEAGPLSDSVDTYIKEKLQLKVTVPGLRLQDNGQLVGGATQGSGDCLEPQKPLATKFPGVIVGPDSTPTLSFTSGSEGRPKGVKGRHFSLAYYFPWMAETFGLSENSRFTMLSGIAHDPIQRDIFTPLFLGAHLLVPSREDIQHEKLAEWFAREQPTVTHLTPAMGQILVGGAMAQFPSLKSAFFVGDILIKRDCRRLQELAVNVSIVNMYGTTETQRAVSYYKIPSRAENPQFLDHLGDVIPAGKGMKDVQLLIVDRENRNRICDIGESGEVYVRAGGLAEGYLGLDDMTAQKFLYNWFVDNDKWVKEDEERVRAQGGPEPWRQFYKGPRDRMYRSGDLGKYMEDGNVNVTGRVDNQVKIRGFRIELGEIDTHLSQHPLVRENVTLVRRDKDEEPTLVSYVVPEMKKWAQWLEEKGYSEPAEDNTKTPMIGMLKRFKMLRDDVRETLKTKLASYAVPTMIIPMLRFPLNPNGKIDKPALPFPEPWELAAAAGRSLSQSAPQLSETEKKLAEIWASLIPRLSVRMIDPDTRFSDAGGNSITAQQCLFKIRQTWQGVNIPMRAFRDPTLRELAQEVDRSLDPIGLIYSGEPDGLPEQDESYSNDAVELIKELPQSFSTAELPSKPVFFLTGATGFLGAFILRDLLQRGVKVFAHVRAKTAADALNRIVRTCKAYGIWNDSWTDQIVCVTGDLEKPNLGVTPDVWDRLAEEVDVVIHNGARVHWVLPYTNLRAANVLSTLAAISLCATGKPKQLGFVSSTSTLDSEHYIHLSEKGELVQESDDLEGSRKTLSTGYGQSKWSSEYLIREARRRGLRAISVRAGYVLGDPETGTTNTDDFLIRLLKGCIQLSARPAIQNTINMVPVPHVARLVVAAALHPDHTVAQVTAHPRLTMEQYTACLATYGYNVPLLEYSEWAKRLEAYVEQGDKQEEHALLPLYHMVTTSLPEDSKAPEMDDRNAADVLKKDAKETGEDWSKGSAVTEEAVGIYLSYLIQLGFLPPPSTQGERPLPEVTIDEVQRAASSGIGGRGGAGAK